MKKGLVLLICVSLLGGLCGRVCAQQQGVHHFEVGDYVTISFFENETQYYMTASSSGVGTSDVAQDDCLWRVDVPAESDTTEILLQDVLTDYYLQIDVDENNPWGAIAMQLTNNVDLATRFRFYEQEDTRYNKSWEEGKYRYGRLYSKQTWAHGTVNVYVGNTWNNGVTFGANLWNTSIVYIEKWEKKGEPIGYFSPSKIEFTFDKEKTAGVPDVPAKQEVQFYFPTEVASYLECVNRPDEIKLKRENTAVDFSDVEPTIYWASNKGSVSRINPTDFVNTPNARDVLKIVNKGNAAFTVQTVGDIVWDLKWNGYGTDQWVDYADNVVAEYEYNGKTYTSSMRVVRKSYHKEEMPPLVFSINPVTYTFAMGEETKPFAITISHQHGEVIYNMDHQAIRTNYEEGPDIIPLNDQNWTLSWTTPNWLSIGNVTERNVAVTTEANGTGTKRSFVLEGTFSRKTADGSGHEHSGTFEIPVHQRGVEGGIKFKTRAGEEWESAKKAGRLQEVHTAERTIYYLPNELIELRLPESGFSGYMRWYDYETGMDPYYNEHAADSTNWVLSPRAADGSPFDAINTPQSAATYGVEGRSYGLYAVNKADGGVLDEDNPSNPAPQLRGWSNGGEHTIACDVSAYTDYTIWYNSSNTTRVDSIQEPTLSYRQLFHLKPASEIADQFANLGEGEYLEEYKYMAPEGKQILLATEFRYKKYRSHESEMCYFYHGTDDKVHRITASTPVVWKEDGNTISSPSYTAEMDYLIVRSDVATTPNKKTYTLTLPAGVANNAEELRIAKFEVEYVSLLSCGPSTTTLISTQRINNNYESLANISFDNQSTHLPWGESSYGYVYSTGELASTKYKRGANQGVFPFYGEYTIVSSVNKDWARQNAHSGKALYVDGTMEPGLVASIYTDAVICSGQTLTCSAWFCNPTPAGWNSEGNPIFRCNVQGRDNDNAPWEDVGVYFVGELLKASGWQQVVFPIQSDKSYAQTRVSIYNFATTNLGNDFMVDDICLFVSPLPLAAYQGEMACRSTSDGGGAETTQAAAVLRLDYSNMDANTSPYVYYQIYNKEAYAAVDLKDGGYGGYYHDAHLGDSHGDDMLYGSVAIPTATYVPSAGKGDLIYQSVSKMLDDMSVEGVKSRKAYIKVVNDGVEKWLLYVAHMLENTSKQDERLKKLYYQDDYEMRMAFAADELSVAECNMQTPLHATKETVFTLRNANGVIADNIHTANDVACCPNMQYMLDAKIKNNFALGIGQLPNTYEAKVYADWLVGSEFDDPYTKGRPTDAEIAAADAAFKAKYGYTRGQVATAIMYDMRRQPTPDSPNDNYTAKSFKELNINHFLSHQNYTIIQHLHEKGLLELYKTTASFYLSNEDTIRYWAYPIAETAKTTIMINDKDSTVILQDCVEAKWVKAVSKNLDGYFLNIAPIKRANMTDEQKAMLPTYKVLKKNIGNAIKLPVTEVGQPITVGAQTISKAGDVISITLPETASSSTSVEIVDLATGNKIGRTSLVAGKEYHVNVSFTDGSGGNFGDCGGGTVTFILAVVPDVLVWTPAATSYNGWGKDENWRGWVDSDKDGVIDSGELVNGYVPMIGADVIIPTMSNAVRYPHIIEEHSHYPMAINYEAHHCGNIYFGPGAHFQNQHLLQYSKAYVDMVVPATKWNLMSTPLKEMYTGDFFVPHSGTYDNGGKSMEISDYFDVSGFQGTRAWNAAYAFWLSFYNQDVNVQNQSGSFVQNATTAEFVPSNSLVQEVTVGGGVSVLGYGPGDKEEDLVVRLPKKDTKYYYYNEAGDATKSVSVPSRSNAHKLAYEPSNDVMSITLTNKVASNKFVFGNPTMSNIDMTLFLKDNAGKGLTGTYYTLESDSWQSTTEINGGRFLAPMRAVLLEVATPAKALTVQLKPSHTTLDNQVKINMAPARITGRQEVGAANDLVDGVAKAEVMTIMGLVDDVCARVSIAVDPNADNAYYKGEDALFISSGVEAGIGTDVATSPMNMYTVAKRVPMMTDVRPEISKVPLSVLVDEDYRSETMTLAFKLSSNWQKVCHFCDAKTGQKIRIYDEMIIQVEMPENHEERYYVEGPDPYNEGGDITTSTTHPAEAEDAAVNTLWAYAQGEGELLVVSDGLIQNVVVYDMLGHAVAMKEPTMLGHEVVVEVPVGVYVVEALMQNGTRQRVRTVVR